MHQTEHMQLFTVIVITIIWNQEIRIAKYVQEDCSSNSLRIFYIVNVLDECLCLLNHDYWFQIDDITVHDNTK